MSNSSTQVINTALCKLKRSQFAAVTLGALLAAGIAFTGYFSQRQPDDELIDIPVLIEAATRSHHVVTLAEKMSELETAERSHLMAQVYGGLQRIEAIEKLFDQSYYANDLKPITTKLTELRQQASALLTIPLENHELFRQQTDDIVQFYFASVSQPIQQAINTRIYFHDIRNARHHANISALLIVCFMFSVAVLVLGPVMSISTIRNTQQRLGGLNRLRGDFLANLTHEIRTPINGIIGMADILMHSETSSRGHHYIGTLQNSAEHLLTLINDVLDFSKIEAGHMKINIRKFNMHELAEDVLSIMSANASSKNVELLLDYDSNSAHGIEADPARLRQILFNLVGNAIKFTDKGYVLVRLKISNDRKSMLHCEVQDTGSGIPENRLGELFRKYAQVDNTSDRARTGTGLGLAICRNLLHLMGGDIEVRSKPGKGSVFSWHIPVKIAEEQPAQKNTALALAGRRIFLMDDLEPNRAMYQTALRQAGSTCVTAENTEEMLSSLRYELECKRKPDMIVLDQYLSGPSGVECARQIRQMPGLATVPILLMTMKINSALVDELAGMNNVAYVVKPLPPARLCLEIAGILEGQRQQTEYQQKKPEMKFDLKILLAEDNRVNAEISSDMLRRLGCSVTLAENGLRSLELAQQEKFDLVLMDCQMPVMDGFEASQHLSKFIKGGRISPLPIIALTANATDEDRDMCLEAGMSDFLCKPVKKNEMENMLKKWSGQQPVVSNESRPPPETNGNTSQIDLDTFKGACSALGPRADTVIGYYIEDSIQHLTALEAALAEKKYREAILPAHSLKSTSQQFGLVHLANLAMKLEKCLRNLVSSTPESASPVTLLSEIKAAFENGRTLLNQQRAG